MSTVADLLERRLRQLGVQRVYGAPLAGLTHVLVDDVDLAVLLAVADLDGVAAINGDDYELDKLDTVANALAATAALLGGGLGCSGGGDRTPILLYSGRRVSS